MWPATPCLCCHVFPAMVDRTLKLWVLVNPFSLNLSFSSILSQQIESWRIQHKYTAHPHAYSSSAHSVNWIKAAISLLLKTHCIKNKTLCLSTDIRNMSRLLIKAQSLWIILSVTFSVLFSDHDHLFLLTLSFLLEAAYMFSWLELFTSPFPWLELSLSPSQDWLGLLTWILGQYHPL